MKSIADSTATLAAGDSTDVGFLADRRAVAAKAVLIELEGHEGQALLGFALRLGLTDMEAQDAVQETLLRLWTRLRAGETIDQPRNWAFRTTYRIAMDAHRLRRRARGLLDRISRATGWLTALEPGGPIDIWQEVDRLSERQRQVVYLRYQADLAYEEIGAVLGITASAARSHGTFALAALRKRLSEVGHD